MILSAKDQKLLDQMLSDATAWNMPDARCAGWEEPPAIPPEVEERIDAYCDLVERLSAGPDQAPFGLPGSWQKTDSL